jgi:hypothetical protein
VLVRSLGRRNTAIVIIRDGVLVEERVTDSDDESTVPRGDVIHDRD